MYGVIRKSCREHCPFISLTAILRAIKYFSCTPVIDKDGDFKDNKDEAKQNVDSFLQYSEEYHRSYSTPTKRNMGYCGK